MTRRKLSLPTGPPLIFDRCLPAQTMETEEECEERLCAEIRRRVYGRNPYAEQRREFAKIRPTALARDGGVCVDCGDGAKHVHHIRRICDGGSNELDNLVSLCKPCHGVRHSPGSY